MNWILNSFSSKVRRRIRIETMRMMTTMTTILKRMKAAHLFLLQAWAGLKSKAIAFRPTSLINTEDEVEIKKK